MSVSHLVRQMGVSHSTWDGYVQETTAVSDLELCEFDPIAVLYLEGDGSSLREMFAEPDVLLELMVASWMVKDELDEREWDYDSICREHAEMNPLPSEVLEEIEWFECCEPSYFKALDLCTGQAHMMTDATGNPLLHDAQRHDQRCSLNDLLNPWDIGGENGTVRTEEWEINGTYSMGVMCDCKLVSLGEAYGVAICEYGAVWVPKSCFPYLPRVGSWFTAETTVSRNGKYPLRVLPRGIH